MSVAVGAFLKRNSALMVVSAAFLWSAGAILSSRHEETPAEGAIVLRLGHWQLEAGVRDAFTAMAAKYHELHSNVTIIQDAVPETTYGQWMSTQLMGGTAPDLLEIGNGLPYNVLLGYYNRYFLPLTAVVNQPNPYNKGTDLENIPWRKTYKDAMRSVYVEEMQEYMRIPLSQFGIRIFYNKDLLKRLTGRVQPPRDYRDFLEVCRQIRAQRDDHGKPYVPIAASAFHMTMWDMMMLDPLTYGALRRLDFNHDGAVGNDELFVGLKTGRIDFNFPPFEAKFRMLRQVTSQFQTGFTGLGRDEAVFLFAQQRAVFMSTGTWDVGSLYEQARGAFNVGIMDFPVPAPDDPEFGAISEGPVYDLPQVGFAFAVSRTCKHPEVALDFLRFLGSQRGHEELNRVIGWIPAVKGTRVSPMLEPFNPHLEGIFPCMPVTLGGETTIKWQQLYSLYQVNQISYLQMVSEFLPFYLEHGDKEWDEMQRNVRRGLVRDDQFLAGMRAMAEGAAADEATTRWIKYRQMVASRILSRGLNTALLQKRLAEGVVTHAVAPYEFSPAVINKVRDRLRASESSAVGSSQQKERQ